MWVRREHVQPPLSKLFDGPYKVNSRNSHNFVLQIGDKHVTVHAVRAVVSKDPVVVTRPIRRGRPPRRLEDPAPLNHRGAGRCQRGGRGVKEGYALTALQNL